MISVYYTLADTKSITTDALKAAIEQWLPELPSEKRQQLQRVRVFEAKLNSLLGLQLLKRGLHQAGRYDFKLQDVVYDDNGVKGAKPRIPGDSTFNITHSKTLVACAITPHGRVGIDTEVIREIKPLTFKSMLSASEQAAAQDDPTAFFNFWTQKEAVLKAESNSGVWHMQHVDLKGRMARYRETDWYLYPLALSSGYTTHLATDLLKPIILTRYIPITQLL